MRRANRLDGRDRLACTVLLHPELAAALHLHTAVGRERVHSGDADAVQSARALLVAVAAELTASVEFRHHHFKRGLFRALWMRLNRNTAPVVLNRDRAIG